MKKEELTPQKRKEYISPYVEVVEIKLEQSFFAGSGELSGLGGEDW